MHVIGEKENEKRLNIKYEKKEIIHNPGDSGILGTSISFIPVLQIKGEGRTNSAPTDTRTVQQSSMSDGAKK